MYLNLCGWTWFLSLANFRELRLSVKTWVWQMSSWWQTSCSLHRTFATPSSVSLHLPWPFHEPCWDIIFPKTWEFWLTVRAHGTPPSSSLLPQPFFGIFKIVQFSWLLCYMENIFIHHGNESYFFICGCGWMMQSFRLMPWTWVKLVRYKTGIEAWRQAWEPWLGDK